MTAAATVVSLKPHRPALVTVDLGEGGHHALQPMDGGTYRLLQRAQEEGQVSLLWEVGQRLLPSAPAAAIEALSLPELEHLFTLATGREASH